MKLKTKAKLAIAGSAGVAMTLAVALPASADYAPQSGDIVGVSGDTPQYDLSFLADGDAVGDSGFNSSGAYNRLVSFSATADANGRAVYPNGSTLSAPLSLYPTDVLRAGTSPVQRISSSGNAISALLADKSNPEVINFVGSASLPTSAQQTTAKNNGWGYLHVTQIATDAVEIAASPTTNAPPLSISDLLGIYTGQITKWSQLPGATAQTSTDTIVPLIPPSTSSITKTFIADLTAANGNTAPTIVASTVEQNDPTAITGNAKSADAIVPFSLGRFNLYNSGYFHNPATAFPGGAAISPGIQLLSGYADGTTSSSANPVSAYSSPVNHYIIFRQSDLASTVPMEPGSTKNWAQTLFSGSRPFVDTSAGQSLIAAAGVTPAYNDLGDVSSG